MIKLYGFGPAFGLPEPSPFVLKVDLYLRINNIEFESIVEANSLRIAPKQKLPFINDNGKVIADSAFIIDHINDNYDVSLDNELSEEQKAVAYLISKSLDENLYWCLVYFRWIDDHTWPIVRSAFFDAMPFPLNKIIPVVARRSVRSQLTGHGIGKHSPEEILIIFEKTLANLSKMLGDKQFFFGDKISSLDVTAFAMLLGFYLSDIDNPTTQVAAKFDNLRAYCERLNGEYYAGDKA